MYAQMTKTAASPTLQDALLIYLEFILYFDIPEENKLHPQTSFRRTLEKEGFIKEKDPNENFLYILNKCFHRHSFRPVTVSLVVLLQLISIMFVWNSRILVMKVGQPAAESACSNNFARA